MANQFVVYEDDRHGLGAWVAEQVAAMAFRSSEASPEATPARELATADYGMSLSGAAPARHPARTAPQPQSLGGSYKTWTSPRSSAEGTMAAVVSGQAAFGVLPLFDDHGFDTGTLAALIDFPQARPQREYVAESNYVLAVPTDLIHEAEQAGFTDSFSSGGGFRWSADKQRKYRQRIATVYASADAMRQCGPAIEGLRAKGIDVQQVPDGVDSYREGLRVAASLLDSEREVETRYGSNGHERRSRTRGSNAKKGLVAVLLTLDRAIGGEHGYAYDADYTVLEAQMAGADQVRTSFLAVAKAEKPAKLVLDPVRAAMAGIDAAFSADPLRPSGTVGSFDYRLSRGSKTEQAGRSDHGASLARVLWKVDTTGSSRAGSGRVTDYSPVLGLLAKAGVPYKVTQIEGRPGNPVVIAFDVERGARRSARPVIRALTKLKGSQPLGTFPATQPLIHPALLPRTQSGGTVLKAAIGALLVTGTLTILLAWRVAAGG